jgi:leucyl-tRNA---protein transferase
MSLREQIVHDEPEACPYLDDRVARLPLRWQLNPLAPAELDLSLANGDRRVGRMLYRTSCPACTACEPIRIPVAGFQPSKSQRRALNRNQDLRIEVGPAAYSDERLALYNRHKHGRGLAKAERNMSRRGYEGWFVESCVQTMEMRYLLGDRLLAVGVVDVGARDTSSVYFYFDPDEERRSLGVYSCLVELDWQRQRGGRFHYLGLYVGDCRHLNYKADYFPHERRVRGEWLRFSDRDAPGLPI